MTALSQTPTSVTCLANTVTELVQAGEAISPGMPVYLKSSDSKYYKALTGGAAEAAAIGVAVGYAPAADDWFHIAKSGDIKPGATMVLGGAYVVDVAAGAISPEADLGTGEFCTNLGRAKTTTIMTLNIKASGVAHA